MAASFEVGTGKHFVCIILFNPSNKQTPLEKVPLYPQCLDQANGAFGS